MMKSKIRLFLINKVVRMNHKMEICKLLIKMKIRKRLNSLKIKLI